VRLLFALILAFIFMPSLASSYASPQDSIAIHVQVKVQNSDGALVAYLETNKVLVTDLAELNALLDSNTPVLHKQIITIGDQKYELIQATDALVHSSPTIVSDNIISEKIDTTTKLLAFAYHDGYPVVQGDKVTTYWTILRPAS
jgi:hypothetical protein